MSRPARHPDIGLELVRARTAGVPWKVLEARWGLRRCRLYLLWRAAAASSQMFINTLEVEGGAAVVKGSEPMNMFGSKPKVASSAPVAAPTKEDPAVEEARRREIISAQKARGRASTILTSGTGVAGDASVASRVLLGG